VILHERITTIEEDAFDGCGSLERFQFLTLTSRLSVLQASHWTEINNKIDEICRVGVERRNHELFVPAAAMDGGSNWENIRRILCNIERLIYYYEMKGATALFELALWKWSLDQAGSNATNRSEHRVEVPGPVKDTILEYFYSQSN
jgi:hypothetical protein